MASLVQHPFRRIRRFTRTRSRVEVLFVVIWTQAVAGETNLDVVVGADRLPGVAPPSAAFFSVTASDGLGDDWADDDNDGVPNAVEQARGTNPRRADTDGDGLTNREECEWGTDPGEPDTDRDGVSDGTEVAQSGDPADAEDGGRPNSRVLATLTLGDHSRSQSEKYSLTFTPVPNSGPGGVPAAISRISARYDGCAPLTVPLKPGWRYEVRLDHAGSDPAYTGTPKPDYDYTLEFSPKPESVLLDDPQGL